MADEERKWTTPDPTAGNLIWEELERVLGSTYLREQPPNSVTVEQLSGLRRFTQSYANQVLLKMVKDGRMERVMFKVPGGRAQWAYYFKEQGDGDTD